MGDDQEVHGVKDDDHAEEGGEHVGAGAHEAVAAELPEL